MSGKTWFKYLLISAALLFLGWLITMLVMPMVNDGNFPFKIEYDPLGPLNITF